MLKAINVENYAVNLQVGESLLNYGLVLDQSPDVGLTKELDEADEDGHGDEAGEKAQPHGFARFGNFPRANSLSNECRDSQSKCNWNNVDQSHNGEDDDHGRLILNTREPTYQLESLIAPRLEACDEKPRASESSEHFHVVQHTRVQRKPDLLEEMTLTAILPLLYPKVDQKKHQGSQTGAISRNGKSIETQSNHVLSDIGVGQMNQDLRNLKDHWDKGPFHCCKVDGQTQDDHVKVQGRQHWPEVALTVAGSLCVLGQTCQDSLWVVKDHCDRNEYQWNQGQVLVQVLATELMVPRTIGLAHEGLEYAGDTRSDWVRKHDHQWLGLTQSGKHVLTVEVPCVSDVDLINELVHAQVHNGG